MFWLPVADRRVPNKLVAHTLVGGLFVAFITLCGITHVLNVVGARTANTACKALTAIVSLMTALASIKLIPTALALPMRADELYEAYHLERNLCIFMTNVLCARRLPEDTLVKLVEQTLQRIFPSERLAIVARKTLIPVSPVTAHLVPLSDHFSLVVSNTLYHQNQASTDTSRTICVTSKMMQYHSSLAGSEHRTVVKVWTHSLQSFTYSQMFFDEVAQHVKRQVQGNSDMEPVATAENDDSSDLQATLLPPLAP